jgi:hypothetical protein
MTTPSNTSGLGLGRRLAVSAVGVAGLVAATGLTMLWGTEPEPLPPRTRAAFAAMIGIGVAWAAFALWSLRHRYPMFGRDRVIAWSIASAGSALAAGIAALIGFDRGWPSTAVGMFVVVALEGVIAVTMLTRAIRRHRELVARRDELVRALRRS